MMSTFSAQFPPTEWFNSKAVHLHCVATQTNSKESLQCQTSFVSSYYDISNRSSTLPRRYKRHLSTESGIASSLHYEHSLIRQCSPSSGSLPRLTLNRSSTNETCLKPFGSSTQGGELKLRDSSRGSLRREVSYSNSDHIINTSGPSSLERLGMQRTPRRDKNQSEIEPMKRSHHASGYSDTSNLESHMSDCTLKPSPSRSNSHDTSGSSKAQSLVKVQSLQSSPKNLRKYRTKPLIVGGETVKSIKNILPKTLPKYFPVTKKKTVTPLHNKTVNNKDEKPTMMASSNSNNLITLKVTTNRMSQNGGGTNTKVYVQNSPVRSVITFENGKVTESSNGSNIYIINDDRQVVSVQNGVSNQTIKNLTETSFDVIAKKNKHKFHEEEPIKVQENKFNKNSMGDMGMNNNRKHCLQIGGGANSNNFIYKNQLNNTNEVTSTPTSPAIHNNIHNSEITTMSNPSTPTVSRDNIIGSLGSLRYQKNSLTSADIGLQTNLNSNIDFKSVDLLKKATALQMLNGIPNNTMSSESMADLLTKGVDQKATVLGSEPNLALKKQELMINTSIKKINSLENKQKRYSLSQESKKENQDFYNFPSWSDLSFNFTSVAAQKILKGASINSVDTLVELNMANNSEKQNNREVAATVCTDFGLV